MGKIRNTLKKAVPVIALAAGLMGGAAGVVLTGALSTAAKTGSTATGVITFSYDGISDGLLPDGSPFLSGKMEAELNGILAETCPGASVTVIGAGNGSRDIPTSSFQVTIHNAGESGESPEVVLEETLSAYREQFKQTYYINESMYEEDPEVTALISSCEYRNTAGILKTETGRWVRYLKAKETGVPASLKQTLSALEDKISVFRDVKITTFSSDAKKMGLSVNEQENYLSLSWELYQKGKTYSLNLLSHQTAKDGIALYDAAMSNTVLVPTLDSHSAFYMSRTKTGIDYLAETAEDYLGWAEDARQDMLELEQTLADLTGGDTAALEARKKELLDEMDMIRGEIRSLDEEIWNAMEPVEIEVQV